MHYEIKKQHQDKKLAPNWR